MKQSAQDEKKSFHSTGFCTVLCCLSVDSLTQPLCHLSLVTFDRDTDRWMSPVSPQ